MTEKDSLQILLYLLCRFSLFITGILQKEFRLSDSIFSNLKTSCPNSTGDLTSYFSEKIEATGREQLHTLHFYAPTCIWVHDLWLLFWLWVLVCLCCVCACMWGGEEGRVGAKEREGGRVRGNRESDNKLNYMHRVTEMNKTDLIPSVNLSCLLS